MGEAEFVNLVKLMRAAQKLYFRTRGQGDLNNSKDLERKVDKVVDELTRQPTLFDGLGDA